MPDRRMISSRGDQVLSGDVVARVLLGEITSWADPAIRGMNSNLTESNLPDERIRFSYTETLDGIAGSQIFTRALGVFSSDFAQALAEAGGKIANMSFGSSGYAQQTTTAYDRFAYVRVS